MASSTALEICSRPEHVDDVIASLKMWIEGDVADHDAIRAEHGWLDLDPEIEAEANFKMGRAHGIAWALKYLGVSYDEVNALFT